MDTYTFISNRYKSEKKMVDASKKRRRVAETWLRDDNVGSWRHTQMIKSVDPIIKTYSKATWLTIGDGRYGKEAHYIWKHGGNVTASNISDQLLKKAVDMKFIPKYRVENAEHLSLKDNAFDFILCQESLHHFPRPFIGLYEMIRVAKYGVIITEPNDIFHDHTLLQNLFWNTKMFVKKIFHIQEVPPFEEIGNYLYRVSVSEIEKIAIALNFPMIAYRNINDKYYEGVEFADMKFSFYLIKVKIWIWILDTLCKVGFLKSNVISIIIWKTLPNGQCLKALESMGFHVIRLPKNPYV